MATLGELKTRVATEMVRDDLLDATSTGSGQGLADQLTLHVQRAIEYFADQQLPFNAIITTAPTVAAAVTVDIPATVRRIDRVTIPAQFQEVREVSLDEIVQQDGATGLPYLYCYYNDQVRLYPTPDAVYTLQFIGLKQIDAPTDDADATTPWTNAAYDLICARTRMTLYRDQFRDPDGAQMAAAATSEALQRLSQEAARRLETPLRGPSHYARNGFNINLG